MASPASKSTARSGNIAPWHLSQVFMSGNLASKKWKTNPPEVLDGTDKSPNGTYDHGPFVHLLLPPFCD
jgi:hypothetical protein